MTSTEDASRRFHIDINSRAVALGMFREHQFVEYMCGLLAETGEMDDCVRCSYQARGVKVDGYCYDSDFGHLTLLVSLWKDETEEGRSRVSKTEISETFHRCFNFYQKSKGNLFERIEIANEAHDLSALIHDEQEEIISVSIIMITDGHTGKNPAVIENIDGVEFKKIIWDIDRITGYIESGEKETIQVDFGEGSRLPCLRQASQDDIYSSFLTFIPGDQLADLYSRYGTKMLEMNVRVFLSARGKVNRGIRETIVNEPAMFSAFNNGITVFARDLNYIPENDHGGFILGATDFQVVNGGQTVASLYHAKRKQKADLSNIRVPMKLVKIHHEKDIDNLVPRISEYSNTQNKISMTDMSANDRPHPELYELSKRVWAPDPTGGSRTTHWFYEKARGSYEETRRLVARTPAEEREFDSLNPKSQRFDKGLLGKVWNTYLRKPYSVSYGAQKNFVEFNCWLKEQETELEPFFKQTVALLILWRDVERLVKNHGFEGYRHNIVTYTLAWMFELTGSKIDLDRIWREQATGDGIREAAEGMCQIVNEHIRATTQNVTEYCKKEACWKALLENKYNLPDSIDACLLGKGTRAPAYDPRTKDERGPIEFCQSKDSKAWFELSTWLKDHSFLTPKARSQCFTMGRKLGRGEPLSKELAYSCKKAWDDAEVRGWSGSTEDKKQ